MGVQFELLFYAFLSTTSLGLMIWHILAGRKLYKLKKPQKQNGVNV